MMGWKFVMVLPLAAAILLGPSESARAGFRWLENLHVVQSSGDTDGFSANATIDPTVTQEYYVESSISIEGKFEITGAPADGLETWYIARWDSLVEYRPRSNPYTSGGQTLEGPGGVVDTSSFTWSPDSFGFQGFTNFSDHLDTPILLGDGVYTVSAYATAGLYGEWDANNDVLDLVPSARNLLDFTIEPLAVPEPSAGWLVISGAAGWLVLAGRRRRPAR